MSKGLSKHIFSNALEEAVFKATQSTVEEPPKPKHITTILNASRNQGSQLVLNEIFKRGVAEKEMISFKTLYVIHRLIRDGSPRTTSDIVPYKGLLESLYQQYQRSKTHYGGINTAYLGFWGTKIKFHQENPEVPGDLSPTKFNASNYHTSELVALCNSILGLQRSVIQLEKKVLETGSLNACSVIPIPPLLYESFNAYSFVCQILQSLGSSKESEPLITEFNRQYPIIQTFYFQCTTIPWIRGICGNIPSLPSQPPKFEPAKKKKAPRPAAPVQATPLVTQQPLYTQQTVTTHQHFFQPQPQVITQNPFATQQAANVFAPPVAQPQPQMAASPFFTNTPPPVANPFATNTPSPFAAPTQLTANPFSTVPKPVATVAPTPVAISSVNYVAENLNADNLESLKQRIRDLESKIRDTESQIQDQKGANSELRQLLSERTAGLASAMTDRLEQQKQDHMNTNQHLRNELQDLMGQYQRDKLDLLLEQVDFAKDGVDDHLFRFDSPEYMGNRGASAADLQRAAAHLKDSMKNLLTTLQNGGDIVGASRSVADWTNKFLDDSKGAMTKINDPNQRAAMAAGTNTAARKVMDMLSHTSQLVPQGVPDEGQLQFLYTEQANFITNLELVMGNVSANAGSLGQAGEQNDLEKCAQQELENANRQIQAISSRLKEVTPSCTGAQQNVAQSVLDASSAIALATGHMVSAALTAQVDRIKLLDSGLAVRRDPMLTEGLLAAAKAVSEATLALARAAFEAAQGRIDDQALITAARAVAASTAQMVAATRAGASGESSDALDRAADAVTSATRSLVESARLFTNAEQLAFVEKTNYASQQVGEEIEKSAEILRLQHELEAHEKRLQGIKAARGGQTMGISTGDAAFRTQPGYMSNIRGNTQ